MDPVPVSYTHLDVYKRQVFRLLYIMDSGDIQLEQSLLSGFIGGVLLLFIGAGPVSYTHLGEDEKPRRGGK